jgi:glutathione S-transferase
MEAPLTTAFVLSVREPVAERLPAVAPWCQRRFAEAARVLDRHLEGRATLLDEGFGVGDITLAGILSWARDDGALAAFPRLDAYRQALLARPAARRAYASDQPT